MRVCCRFKKSPVQELMDEEYRFEYKKTAHHGQVEKSWLHLMKNERKKAGSCWIYSIR